MTSQLIKYNIHTRYDTDDGAVNVIVRRKMNGNPPETQWRWDDNPRLMVRDAMLNDEQPIRMMCNQRHCR